MIIGESQMVVEQAKADAVRLRQQLTKANRHNAELKGELESNRDKHEAEQLRNVVAELEHQVRAARPHQRDYPSPRVLIDSVGGGVSGRHSCATKRTRSAARWPNCRRGTKRPSQASRGS